MKLFWLGVVALLIVSMVGAVDVRAEAEDVKRATDAALIWLALMDEVNYSQSWSNASSYFRGAVTQKSWETSLRGLRKPLGNVVSRDVMKAASTASLPGAPDGNYVVIQLGTSFADKASATETVTFTKESDGRWRAAGYFIR